MNSNLLRAKELCELLKIGRTTLYKWEKEKRVYRVMMMTRVFYDKEKTIELLSNPNAFIDENGVIQDKRDKPV